MIYLLNLVHGSGYTWWGGGGGGESTECRKPKPRQIDWSHCHGWYGNLEFGCRHVIGCVLVGSLSTHKEAKLSYCIKWLLSWNLVTMVSASPLSLSFKKTYPTLHVHHLPCRYPFLCFTGKESFFNWEKERKQGQRVRRAFQIMELLLSMHVLLSLRPTS